MQTCCGNSLQTGAKIIAIFELVCGFIGFGIFLVILISLCNEDDCPTDIYVPVGLLVGFAVLANSLISYILYRAASKLKPTGLYVWLFISGVGLILSIVKLIQSIPTMSHPVEFLLELPSIGLQSWFIAIVYSLLTQIKRDQVQNAHAYSQMVI